ncbi:hypothetical protein Ssi03_10530 [Sphaerisporangium siamense]|nr:hypothetical protein Ssi03_10530 [Sphaerisporangium siamense]
MRPANDTPYALASPVLSRDVSRGAAGAAPVRRGRDLGERSSFPRLGGGVEGGGPGGDVRRECSVARDLMIEYAAPEGRDGFRPA